MPNAMASGRATRPTVMPAPRSWLKSRSEYLRRAVTERGSQLGDKLMGDESALSKLLTIRSRSRMCHRVVSVWRLFSFEMDSITSTSVHANIRISLYFTGRECLYGREQERWGPQPKNTGGPALSNDRSMHLT